MPKLTNCFHPAAFALLSMVVLFFLNVAPAARLVEITNFGTNPTGVRMFEYVPDKVAASPALLVVLHGCFGWAQGMFMGSKFSQLADKFGFIVVYPDAAGSPTKCWDVWTTKGLQRDGGGDSQGIVSMVQYEIKKRRVNPRKVSVVGHSSGAMMTNVLLAEYPDVFQAGSLFAGVPFGCFLTTDPRTWFAPIPNDCTKGNVVQSPQQWGDLVRKADPGFTGTRPRVQLFHGTNDFVLVLKTLEEEVKQWTNVLGLSPWPTTTDKPDVSSFRAGVTDTRKRYGGGGDHALLEVNTLQNADHSLITRSVLEDMSARFLGLIP